MDSQTLLRAHTHKERANKMIRNLLLKDRVTRYTFFSRVLIGGVKKARALFAAGSKKEKFSKIKYSLYPNPCLGV